MAIIGELVTVLAGDNRPLLATVGVSEARMKLFGANTSAALLPLGVAALGVGVAAVAGMAIAVKAAGEFEEQMATVNTIARLTPDALADIGLQVRRLSTETGIALPDLTSAMYDLLSVGVPVADVMEVLANATTLGIGGLSSTKDAADAITTALNAWSIAGGRANLTMSDSTKVMDIFAKAIETGGLTASDIPGALAQVAPQAAALSVPLEEVAAGWAVMTTRGFSAAEAATSMNSALVALQRIPPGMQLLEDKTGKSYAAIARTEGAQAAMAALVADAQKYGIQLIDVFGRQEALGYALNVTGAAAPAYQAALTSMYDSAGTAAGQAAERENTFNHQLDVLSASIHDLEISAGTGLLPVLTSVVQGMNGAAGAATAWAQANPEVASSIGPIIAGVGLLTAAVILTNVAVGLLGVLLSPIAILIAGIAASAIALANALNQNNMIASQHPDWTPDQIAAYKYNMGDEAYRTAAEKHGYGPAGGPSAPAWGSFNTPGFHAGEVGSPFYGPATPGSSAAAFGGGTSRDRPIQINHTTRLEVDGERLAEIIERKFYNNASTYSSGFSAGPTPIR